MSETITLEVFRYDPDTGNEPTFQSYEVPCRKDWVILDALNHVKDQDDGSLTFRWSCRMGVCGSCGMMVNGEPVLTCATFLTKYLPGPVRIEPLDHFPVIKDLVIEMSDFVKKLTSVKPWVIKENDAEVHDVSGGEFKQSPEQLSDFKQYSMCINCMLCYSACPVYGLEPIFIGPAAIALAQRYNLDSRDDGTEEREMVISQEDGIWQCTFVGECSAVCPKNVDPAQAIQRYKVQATNNWWKSVLMPFGTRDKSKEIKSKTTEA